MKRVSALGVKDSDRMPESMAIFNPGHADPMYHEQFKGLRAKVEHRIDSADLRCIAVSSAIAGEGKTLTAINLAINMASTGRKQVLLMDADLRKANVVRELFAVQGPGLSEYLLGDVPREKVIRNSTVPGLYLIPGGRPIPSPADFLSGEKFRSLLRDAREQFDLLILDTPPILPVPDALAISEQVDAFILLFRLDHTPHKLFQQAVEELGEGKILGIVLNGEEPKSEKYYSRYYGKYYRNPDTEGENG